MFCLICGGFTSFAEGKVLFIFQIAVSSSDVPLQLKHPGFSTPPCICPIHQHSTRADADTANGQLFSRVKVQNSFTGHNENMSYGAGG